MSRLTGSRDCSTGDTYMGRSRSLTPLIALALIAGGCHPHAAGDDADRSEAAAIVWQGQQCGIDQFTARPIDDAPALEAVLAEVRRSQLGGDAESARTVDFSSRRALLVALGQKPTSGYRIELAPRAFELTSDGARLRLTLVRPSADRMQAQMLTSPCAVLEVPRGDYDHMALIDQRGRMLGRLAVE